LKKGLAYILVLVLLFIFPQPSFAMEFTITDVKMEAFLQADGTVNVEETHTYEFEGNFNGITREVVPKEDAEITQFTAFESGKSLKVEKEDGLYKIHRKGKDETITVTLLYTIKNGMEIYEDVAQFYWPFFDSRNETTYEKLTITIHPPEATNETIAFGYDEAFNTETIGEDGTVLFQLGEVPSGTNGDIRVAYPVSLFSSAAQISNEMMKDEILNAKQTLIEKTAAKAATRETLSSMASIGIPAFSIILFLLMLGSWWKARSRRSELKREGMKFKTLPNLIMSLPATIYYTNNKYLPSQSVAAAFLDLIRQGYVTKTAEDVYTLTGKKSSLKHEMLLMDWLFEKIGSNSQFHFDDLTAYTKNKKNHAQYQLFQTQWREAVKNEVNSHSLYKKVTKYRLSLFLSSLLVLTFMILFIIYNLLGWFSAALVLFMIVLIYASLYHPRTWEGARIDYEWRLFKERFKEISQSEWEAWPEDDKMRAYIYGLGISAKEISRKNDELIKAFTPPPFDWERDHYHPASLYGIAYTGSLATFNFRSVDDSISSTSTSSSSYSSGGGTGGGGGGSGAF